MSVSGGFGLSQALIATARSLAVDGVTREVVTALQDEGIECILLKGPTVATWLYDDGAARFYMDSDLLVAPRRFGRAEALLSRLGFVRGASPVPPPRGELPHAEPWHRAADGAEVDLHRTLSGLGVAPEEAWEVLSSLTEPMPVGGATVEVLQRSARALLVVLHAAQHGSDKPKPLEDLSRALERLPEDGWIEVAALAALLDATPGLASGLRLLPAGAELAERLDLVSTELVDATRRGSPARVAVGFERLASAGSLGASVRLLRREFFPTPAFLRWWSPLARRGRVGLTLAYLWRPLWLLWHGIPSAIAWRRSRAARARARRAEATRAVSR